MRRPDQVLLRIIRDLRFGANDTSTEAGRGRERQRRVALSALAAGVSRLVSIGTTLLLIPLALGYLGAEQYGLWMTLTSVTTMLAFADLGIGNALLNTVADANGRNDKSAAITAVSSAAAVLTCVAVLLSVAFAIAYPHIDWRSTFNVEHAPTADLGPAVAGFAACFFLGIPLGITARVQLAYQEGFAIGLWNMVSSIAALAGVYAAIRFDAGLVWVILAGAGVPVLTNVANAIVQVLYQRPWLRPSLGSISRTSVSRIVSSGLAFVAIQLSYTVTMASDNLIIAHYIGLANVAAYSIASRLFAIVTMVVLMVLSPLWPAYSEAIARGDVAWAKKTLWRAVFFALGSAAVGGAGIVVLAPFVVPWWLGSGLAMPFSMLGMLWIWISMVAVANAFGMFLNGLDKVRAQAVFAVIMAIGALALKILLAPTWGVNGVIAGSVIAYALLSVLPLVILTRRALRGLGVGGGAAT